MAGGLVQSVLRALDLLEAAGASEVGLTVGELAEALRVKVPTAFNLARTLVSRGYLERTTRRPIRYRLGPALPELAGRQTRRQWLNRAESEVRALFDRLRTATVLVAEPVGGDAVPCLRLDPSRPAVVERDVNRHLAPYGSAVVLCLQAFSPAVEVQAFRERYPFGEYGHGAWESLAALDTFLAGARASGHILVTSSTPVRAAAPVFGAGGRLIACVGASLGREVQGVPPERIRELSAAVVEAAARLGGARLLASGVQGRRHRTGDGGTVL